MVWRKQSTGNQPSRHNWPDVNGVSQSRPTCCWSGLTRDAYWLTNCGIVVLCARRKIFRSPPSLYLLPMTATCSMLLTEKLCSVQLIPWFWSSCLFFVKPVWMLSSAGAFVDLCWLRYSSSFSHWTVLSLWHLVCWQKKFAVTATVVLGNVHLQFGTLRIHFLLLLYSSAFWYSAKFGWFVMSHLFFKRSFESLTKLTHTAEL